MTLEYFISASTRLRYWKSFIETGNFCQTQVNTRIQTHQVTHKVSHSIVYSSTVSQSDEFREVMDLDKSNEHSLIFKRNLIPIIYTFYNYRLMRIMVITWKKTQAWNKTRKEEQGVRTKNEEEEQEVWHPENRMIQFYNNNSILPFYKCNQYIESFSL